MNRLSFLSGLFLLPACIFGQNTDPLGGKYDLKGYDAQLNQHYSGSVLITEKSGVYSAKWTFNDQSTYTGTGVKSNSSLAFVFKQDNADTIGVQLYDVKEDDTLEGPWVRFGSATKGTEKLTKQ